MDEDKLSKRIEFICAGEWYMDFNRGIQALTEFINEILLAESGIKTSDLADKRKSSILTISSESHQEFISRRTENGNLIDIQPGSIAKISLSGVMKLNDGPSSLGTRSLENEINFAKFNPNIGGLIVEVSSGGGEAFAGNHMHNALSNFGKPFVAAVHYADSAAYMAITSANEIIGLGGMAEVGSIGALWQADKRILDFIKNNILTIYSDKSSQKNKSINAVLLDDHSVIKKELNDLVANFHSIVIKHRGLDPKSDLTKDTLEGDVFTGKEAIKRGLMDRVGSMDIAVERLKTYIKYNKKK